MTDIAIALAVTVAGLIQGAIGVGFAPSKEGRAAISSGTFRGAGRRGAREDGGGQSVGRLRRPRVFCRRGPNLWLCGGP
jgi:hypothetical protein